MQNFFKSFKQSISPSYLGVDIGTTSIKVVEVESGKNLPKVVNYGFLESSGHLAHANRALQTSTLKLFEGEVLDLLRLIVKETKPRAVDALASLPIFSAFTTIVDFPEMDRAELEKSIGFQAKQYIPMPLSEVAIDWLNVGSYEDANGFKHQQILLISVPLEQIKKYQDIFRGAGLRLKALEIESLSSVRIIADDPTPTVIVDIGSRSTNISFLDKGQFKFSSQSDFAGSSLTQALVNSLGINPLRAEELKKEHGILAEGPNYEMSTIMLPFLDAIINEVKKAMYRYENQIVGSAKIERIMLAGGGANLKGIENYFRRDFNLPVAKADPFAKFECSPGIEPMVAELGPIMNVALGLTMREFQ